MRWAMSGKVTRASVNVNVVDDVLRFPSYVSSSISVYVYRQNVSVSVCARTYPIQ